LQRCLTCKLWEQGEGEEAAVDTLLVPTLLDFDTGRRTNLTGRLNKRVQNDALVVDMEGIYDIICWATFTIPATASIAVCSTGINDPFLPSPTVLKN
jgi:hypothetical protein